MLVAEMDVPEFQPPSIILRKLRPFEVDSSGFDRILGADEWVAIYPHIRVTSARHRCPPNLSGA